MRLHAFAFAFGVVIVACAVPAGRAAEMNGPMSSGYKQNTPAEAQPATAKGGLDVRQLFANTCGWCHGDGGRTAGKGPQLMGTSLTDAEIIHRIKAGKPGAMPAFESAFSDADILAIVAYIRSLRPEDAPR
jgi:mono/diheme cytochrome c family protein